MENKTAERIHAEQLADGPPLWISEDYSMRPGDYVIIADSSAAAVTITLPSKAQACGKFYYICAPSGASFDVSVNDKEAGTEISTYGDMDADDDHAIFFCDGRKWRTWLDGVA